LSINIGKFDLTVGPSAALTSILAQKISKKSIAIVSFCLVLLGTSLFSMRERILYTIGDFLVERDKLETADVILVIAGPDEYTDYPVRLYQHGYGKKISFRGKWRH
jgi:hypothetical protein